MHLMADIIDPFPGRAARAFEISVVCALVVLVSMTYGIPDPATSAYVIFFAAKEDCGGSIIATLALVIVVTIVVAMAFGLALVSLNSPEARILILGGWTFATFFLASASRLAALAGTIGLIVAYAVDLFGSAPLGEIATRGLLYAWLFVAMPMGVFLVYNLLFGRRPDALARETIARRLRAVAALLGDPNGSGGREHVREHCKGGNEELLKLVKMTGLFRFQPPSRVKQLRALGVMTYNLSVAVLAAVETEPEIPPRLATQAEELADAVGQTRQVKASSDGAATDGYPVVLQGLLGAIGTLVAEIRSVAVGGAVPELAIPDSPKAKSGLLRPDAFHNPDHTRYALKGAFAVMVCYLTFTLLDWPAIHTCMLTCFIVGLTTVGESMQKLLLRITGCMIGAAFGYLAIVYVVPQLDSISELMILIGAVTLPAAWVAVGRPSVSYIGFQAALALYLCILQGDLPKFDLTVVRDRTIGIIFGNLVIYLTFTRVFPVSVLSRGRDQLLQLLASSRDLLHGVPEAPGPFEAGWRAAALQASLEEVERSATALGYENPQSAAGRRRRDAIKLSIASLRSVIDTICRLAVCSSLDRDRVRSGLESESLKVDAQLADLADALAKPGEVKTDTRRAEQVETSSMAPSWRDGFVELEQEISELSSALYDYQSLLRLEQAPMVELQMAEPSNG